MKLDGKFVNYAGFEACWDGWHKLFVFGRR